MIKMKNNMTTVNILFGIVLMILVLIQTFNSVKMESHRQELQQVGDFLQSRKDTVDSLISRFDGIISDMASDNERNAVLKNHAIELDKLVKGLKYEQDCLESGNQSMRSTRKRLLTIKGKLMNETNEIREKIRQRKLTIAQLEIQIDSLKRIRAGFGIEMDNGLREELSCLSEPVSGLNIPPSVKSILASHGITCIGELACLDRDYLQGISGIGPVSVERIDAALQEKGAYLGMEAVKVNDRWYKFESEENGEQTAEQTQEQATE